MTGRGGRASAAAAQRPVLEHHPRDGLTLGQMARLDELRARGVQFSSVEGVHRAVVPLGGPRSEERVVARYDLPELLRLVRRILGLTDPDTG
jgi:hypothetical protein